MNTLAEFETTHDLDHRVVQLRICTACSAIINATELASADSSVAYARDENQVASENFYGVGIPNLEVIYDEITNYGLMLDVLESQCGSFKDMSILDFGFGKGTFMLAAAKRFTKVIGVDFNLQTFQSICGALKAPPGISVFHTLGEVPEAVDVVFAWHTLEHLTDLCGVLSQLRRVTKTGGWLIAQVPLFRPAYLCRTHFMFLNSRSADVSLRKSGYVIDQTGFDIANSFMTIFARAV